GAVEHINTGHHYPLYYLAGKVAAKCWTACCKASRYVNNWVLSARNIGAAFATAPDKRRAGVVTGAAGALIPKSATWFGSTCPSWRPAATCCSNACGSGTVYSV